jgi:hypothetical protein
MATGLLGFNPYGGGTVLDFSSKPINLAIQLEQKEAAKRDALDKYFMDYEKNIDPTVMRSQDRNIVLEKLNKNKEFYLKNRDCILNPAKCGAEYQSQYMATFKDIMSDISKSKEAAKNDDLVVKHWMSQKGLNAPNGYEDAVAKSHLPINQGYEPMDVTKYPFYKTFDPVTYSNKLKNFSTAGIPVPVRDPAGFWYSKKEYKVQPQDVDKVILIGKTDYDNKNNQDFINFIDEKFNDGITVSALQQKYPNKPIASPRDLAGIFALDFTPTKTEEGPLHQNRAPRVGRGGSTTSAPTGNEASVIIENMFSNGRPATYNIEGQTISGKIINMPDEIKNIGNRKIGSSTFSPDKYFMDNNGVVYPIFVTGRDASGNEDLSAKGAKKGTRLSDAIDPFNLALSLNKHYGGQKTTLNFINTQGGGATKKKTGASGLN